jgi:fatty acid desaturase
MNTQTYPTTKKYKYKIYKFDHSILKEIKSLAKLDNWHGILALLEDYFVIILSILITYRISWYFYPFAILIIGARQRGLATLLHEAAHGTLAKNKYLNFVIGSVLSGYLIFQNFSGYKKNHVELHHRFLGHSSLDPDYSFHISQGLYNNINPNEFTKKYIIQPLLLAKVPNYLYALIKNRLLVKGANWLEQILMQLYLLAIFLSFWLVNHEEIIILFWLVPYLTTFQIIGWFIELSEHYPLVKKYNIDLYMTRNRNSHWIESLFLSIHNENYHLDHHLNPSTPFWNLPKAHKIRLRDSNYAEAEESVGGIFVSSNNALPILQSIVKQLEHGYSNPKNPVS